MKTKLMLISFLLFSITGGANGSVSQKRVHVQREFVLRAGNEVLVTEAKLTVKFKEMVEDSRCPEGLDCIWAGNGKISLTVTRSKHKPVSFELNTTTEPTCFTYENYVITLVKLAPYPKKDITIRPQEYVATLKVTKKVG